jgi:enoyl-[acyl-carrier protein] reductase II
MQKQLLKMLNISYPIIQAGMVWCSGWRLASACANSGILGLIGSGSMKPDLLREHITKAKAHTHGTFGVNIPLLSPYADALIGVVLEEKINVVVTAAGSPKKYTRTLKENGAVVGHVVPSAMLAQKCEVAGVDFVIAEGTEAGGHNSPDEITTMVLIPQVVDAVTIPVVAAGGIADGRAIAAVLALGAAGAQIGTRFAATVESSAAEAYKNAIVSASESATVLALKKLVPTRMLKNPFALEVLAREANGASREELRELLGKGRAKAGIFNGEWETGEFEVGQVAGAIRSILPVATLTRQLVAETNAAIRRLQPLK